MKLNNFNILFFLILIVISCSLLQGAWSYKSALDIIKNNAQYEHLSQEQERQFNEWDLERAVKTNFYLGLVFFILTLCYIWLCIDFRRKKENIK